MICGPAEIRLIDNLLAKYKPLERPSRVESQALIVEFTVTLQQIMDVDEKNQVINTNLWLSMVRMMSSISIFGYFRNKLPSLPF